MLISDNLYTVRKKLRRGVSAPNLGWTPLDLGSGLLAWWTADRADLITIVGSGVSSFLDCKNGFAFTQSNASFRPGYSDTAFNGAPALLFDGALTRMTTAGIFNFPTGDAPGEIWGVVDQQAASGDAVTRTFFGYGSTVVFTERRLGKQAMSGVNRGFASSADGASNVFSVNMPVVFNGRHLVQGVYAPNTVTGAVDGDVAAPSAVVQNTAAVLATLGRTCQNTSGYWNGLVRDVVVTMPLSAADTARMTEWGNVRRNP